jgi:ATP-dependent Clp protease adapter protein ClpS
MNWQAIGVIGAFTLALGLILAVLGWFLAKWLNRKGVLAMPAHKGAPDFGRLLPPHTSLLSLGGFEPPGFFHGVEILNDDKTPMEFVVSTFTQRVPMSRKDAIEFMLRIHRKGGVIIPTASMKEAEELAGRIAADAAGSNHPLICRAISAQQGAPADVARPAGERRG